MAENLLAVTSAPVLALVIGDTSYSGDSGSKKWAMIAISAACGYGAYRLGATNGGGIAWTPLILWAAPGVFGGLMAKFFKER